MPRYSPLVDRIAGERVDAWNLHFAAATAKARGEDVIVLSVGDPDFATPAPIVDTAVAALRGGDTHYCDIPGRPELRAAIARLHSRRAGQAVEAGNVIVVAGAQNGLFSAALCLCGPGDEVIVPEPMYLSYEATIGAAGATMVTVPMPKSRGFRLDEAALHAAVTPRTRAIFFANPCNPTGLVSTPEELAAIADVARAHDLWVVADEVYAALPFDRPHISIASLPGMAERTVTVNSLSKSHAMTGWRAGWAVGPKPLVAHMNNLAMCMLYGLPGFIQTAALSAIERYDAVADDMRELYRHRRDLVLRALDRVPGLAVTVPEAGMFMLIDVTGTGLSAADFTWRLYRETGVALLDAGTFGPSTEGHVRLSFAEADNHLTEACRRIAAFTGRLASTRERAPAEV